ncbi:sulfatase [Tundrisphaera lichenicola]|uniref:sulfatase n=1 Tax=Tundrisphaera lichenicola TaxID=2029860 RepID=UPI003EB89308
MAQLEGHITDRKGKPTSPNYLLVACWLGLVLGLIEVGLLLYYKYQNHVSLIGTLRLNRHYPWMVPASHLAIFAGLGLALELLRRFRPKLGSRVAPLTLATLALFSLLLTIRVLDTIACVLLAGGLASQLIPRLRRFAEPFRRLVGISLPLMLAGLAVLVVGRHAQFAWARHKAEARPTAVGSPNVLFIVLDTVRAKSLSLYGYPRDTTPRLSSLAAKGVAFTEARSTAPWTLPSHASMFTGRWPSDLFQHPEQQFDPAAPTLAQYLSRNGYATGGFVANTFYCNSGFGMGRGFDRYEDFYETFDTTPGEVLRHSALGRRFVELVDEDSAIRPDGRKDADRINADFLDWLTTQKHRPFFGFLNYLDAHAPYIVPANAERRFGNQPITPEQYQILSSWQKLKSPPSDPKQLELARDAYDDCIAYLDHALGQLFDQLDRRGILENTIVIVTSDHGEELGEHQLIGHGQSLYREEVHVPLLLVKPGRLPSGLRITEPVSLRDLPATIVDLLGLPESSPFPGRSLAALWSETPTDPDENRVVRSEVALREKASKKRDRPPALRGPMTSVIAEGMSYIRNADSTEELYRLSDDVGEDHNLAESESARPILERLRMIADRKLEVEPNSEVALESP